MADFDTAEFRAARFNRGAADQIAERSFPMVMRGYDRAAVDAFVAGGRSSSSRSWRPAVAGVRRAAGARGGRRGDREHPSARPRDRRRDRRALARPGRGPPPAGRARGGAGAAGRPTSTPSRSSSTRACCGRSASGSSRTSASSRTTCCHRGGRAGARLDAQMLTEQDRGATDHGLGERPADRAGRAATA